jgi:hypothetical protein
MIDPVNRGRPWTGADRTAGPVDEVFDQLRRHIPGLIAERLEATHPADDDNVYFIGDEHGPDRIQLDTAPGGQPLFYIENGGRHKTSEAAEAAAIIRSWLEHSRTETATGPPTDASLSTALISWTGWGLTAWPQRDEQRLASQLGADAAAELLPQLRRLEDDFYASNARYIAPDLAAMGRTAADDFRRLHPEISDDAIEALTWCYTYDYK